MLRPFLLVICLGLAACAESPRATNALCDYCQNDSQCGGNPCFQDVSGSRFCGAPCPCPTGYSCVTVMGTSGLAKSCFPDSEACMPGMAPGGTDDAGVPNIDGSIVVSGPVGPSGGTVQRLLFGVTGDTRPATCGGSYPSSIIASIFDGMRKQNVQFALDQGDHMFNCGSSFADAATQMQLYVSAAATLGKTVFMTMGNHECSGESTALCTTAVYGHNANYTAFIDALRTISPLPYYRFDVQTENGLAVFLVVADDVWDATEQSWLEQQLTDADAKARYTFVSKHHPDGNTDHPQFQQIYDLVTSHKFTLFFTGHSHYYRHESSRVMVLGCGGAPLTGGNFWGYGIVAQQADGSISVTVYDQASGAMQDSFTVQPQ